MTLVLPRAGAPLVDGAGPPTPAHFTWCRLVTEAINAGQLTGTTAQEAIAAIATALGSPDGTVANIPTDAGGGLSPDTLALGLKSIEHFGSLADGQVSFALRGDVTEPGASQAYGTDADGVRGWYPAASDPVIAQDTAPALPSDYPFWFDSSTLDLAYQYDDGTSVQWVVPGGGGGGGGAASAGSQVGYARTVSTTTASTADASIPGDNTVPQITEGVAYPSLDTTITPSASTSLLEISVFIPGCTTAGTGKIALFRDSGANAIAATFIPTSVSGGVVTAQLQTVIAAGSTAATTFKVRWCSQSGTSYLLSPGGAPYLGAAHQAVMTIREIAQ